MVDLRKQHSVHTSTKTSHSVFCGLACGSSLSRVAYLTGNSGRDEGLFAERPASLPINQEEGRAMFEKLRNAIAGKMIDDLQVEPLTVDNWREANRQGEIIRRRTGVAVNHATGNWEDKKGTAVRKARQGEWKKGAKDVQGKERT